MVLIQSCCVLRLVCENMRNDLKVRLCLAEVSTNIRSKGNKLMMSHSTHNIDVVMGS